MPIDPDVKKTLDMQFASGGITEEEYRQRLTVLEHTVSKQPAEQETGAKPLSSKDHLIIGGRGFTVLTNASMLAQNVFAVFQFFEDQIFSREFTKEKLVWQYAGKEVQFVSPTGYETWKTPFVGKKVLVFLSTKKRFGSIERIFKENNRDIAVNTSRIIEGVSIETGEVLWMMADIYSMFKGSFPCLDNAVICKNADHKSFLIIDTTDGSIIRRIEFEKYGGGNIGFDSFYFDPPNVVYFILSTHIEGTFFDKIKSRLIKYKIDDPPELLLNSEIPDEAIFVPDQENGKLNIWDKHHVPRQQINITPIPQNRHTL